jgi:hypothetical protein
MVKSKPEKKGSDSKRRRKSFRTHTTSTSVRIWSEQYRAIGWVGEHLYAVIFEAREDEDG